MEFRRVLFRSAQARMHRGDGVRACLFLLFALGGDVGHRLVRRTHHVAEARRVLQATAIAVGEVAQVLRERRGAGRIGEGQFDGEHQRTAFAIWCCRSAWIASRSSGVMTAGPTPTSMALPSLPSLTAM